MTPASALPVAAATEVARAASPTTLQTVTVLVAAVAGAALVVLVVGAWRGVPAVRTGRRWWNVAVLASAVEFVLLSLSLGSAVGTDHRVLAVAGRVGLLAAAGVVERRLDAPTAARGRVALGLPALVTVPLAMPAAGTSVGAPLAWGALPMLVAVAWLVLGRMRGPAVRAALLVVVAGVFFVVSTPPAGSTVHTTRLAAADVWLDVTVVPDDRELHVYVRDLDGSPTAMHEVAVRVPPYGVPEPLFEVSPDHHLSLALELPDERPLVLELRGVRGDRVIEVRWTLEEP